MKFILAHWKDVLLVVALLIIAWAFMPSWATKRGAEADATAKAAIERANERDRNAHEAEKTAREATEKYLAIQVERDALAKAKADLAARNATLSAKIPPRPALADSVDPALVQQLYDAIEVKDALIAKHVQDDEAEARFIASLQKAEAAWRTAAEERGAANEELRKALAAKDIQISIMKTEAWKGKLKSGIRGAVLWELVRGFVLHS